MKRTPLRGFRTSAVFILAVFIFIPGFSDNISADYLDNPDPVPGWTHTRRLTGNSPVQHGIVLSGGDVTYSSPAVGDIDGDPSNGLETAVGGADGILYAYRADGSLLWSHPLPIYGCGGSGGTNKLLSSPAIGKLYGDGVPYVVVGYGGVGSKTCGGGLVAVRGPDGRRAWTFDLRKFSKKAKFGTNSHTVFSSPALADTDGDGKMEIGFGSFDRNVYLLDHNGKVRWYYNAADTIWSSPAFANVDNDPQLEMIIGTDISKNPRLKPRTLDGGYVYAFKTKSLKGRKIPFRTKSAYVWKTFFNQVVYSSPVVADVLPGNPGPEIIVGSGCFFPQNSSKKRGQWIKILNRKNGKVLKTLNAPGCLTSTPAVGDIDDDGVLEIVATSNGHQSMGGDGLSRISAWKASGVNPIWSIVPRERGGRNNAYGGNFMSPVIADLDGNGSLEVIAANGSAVGVFEGRTGAALTCQGSDCRHTPFMLYAWDILLSTPAVADINMDGKPDVIIGGGHSSNGGYGMLYGWTNLENVISSRPGAHPPYSAPWPMYRGNAAHTAVHRP